MCCAAQGACAGCAARVREARASEEVRAALPLVRAALETAAREADAPVERVEDAFALAAGYDRPQRALTCALYVSRVLRLRERLRAEGRGHELHTLRACAAPSAHAVWRAVGTVAPPLANATLVVALRMSMALPVMSAEAVRCRTVGGYESKRCSALSGAPRSDGAEREEWARAHPRAADQHALTCKCGGGAIHTHDGVVEAVAKVLKEWGVPVRTEDRTGLEHTQKRMDLVAPLGGDWGTAGLMVDFTRRYGGDQEELRKAEEQKEEKYNRVYGLPVTMRGAAYNELAELGGRGREVITRLVTLGEDTTGAHPEDLRLELLARLGAAVHLGNAASMAYFRKVNDDIHGFAPTERALVPAGMNRVLGVRGALAPQLSRGRGRPRKQAGPAPAARSGGAGEQRCTAAGGQVANEVSAGAQAGRPQGAASSDCT